MAVAIPNGWQETGGGIVAPPLPPPAQQQMWTPEFTAFMAAVQEHLGEIQDWVSKSISSRAPLTQPLSDLAFVSPWQGVKVSQHVSGLNPETLRAMADRNPVIAAIIATRCNQIAAFCQLPESKTDVGLKVSLRDRDRQPTKDEQREMRELEDMILECGFSEAEDVRPDITFEHAVRQLVRDSLTLDAAVFEIMPGLNRAKYPVMAFEPIDAAQIYLTIPKEYKPKRSGEANIVAVQMQNGEVVAEYAKEDIAYGIRNPSTSQVRQGYGTSELEWLIRVVSCILFGLDYNEKYFTTGSVPPGILSIAGKHDTATLEGFKQQWRALLQGPGNYWRTPIFGTQDGQGIQYIKFRDSNRDMEYHQFLAFLITIGCAVYNIHPEEIGMQSWAAQTSTLNQPSPQARIEASADRGLKPILKLFANLITKKMLWQMYPDRKYVFRWVNIDPADEERELRLRQLRLEMGLTTPRQEIADADMELHDFADVPVNSYHFQAWQMQQQYGDQGQGEEGEGEEPGLPFPVQGEEEEEQEGRELAPEEREEQFEALRRLREPKEKSLREQVIEVTIDE